MLIEQIIEFELRGSGPPGRTYTPTTGYFQCWAPQDFFLVRRKQTNFNFRNLQPQVPNCPFKRLVRNRKSATTFQNS